MLDAHAYALAAAYVVVSVSLGLPASGRPPGRAAGAARMTGAVVWLGVGVAGAAGTAARS